MYLGLFNLVRANGKIVLEGLIPTNWGCMICCDIPMNNNEYGAIHLPFGDTLTKWPESNAVVIIYMLLIYNFAIPINTAKATVSYYAM